MDETHTGDAAIAVIAARQHGVVTTAQLAAAGLGRRAVAHRVAHGRLVRRHRGVYQVGPSPAPLSREMAAVLACGEGAALSHQSAGSTTLPPSTPSSTTALCRAAQLPVPRMNARVAGLRSTRTGRRTG
jgi:hypothetical protein